MYNNLSQESVAGFYTGESNLFITVKKSKTKSGLAVWLRFFYRSTFKRSIFIRESS